MPSNERPTENLQDIRRRFDEAMRELNSLEQEARDAEEELKKKNS